MGSRESSFDTGLRIAALMTVGMTGGLRGAVPAPIPVAASLPKTSVVSGSIVMIGGKRADPVKLRKRLKGKP